MGAQRAWMGVREGRAGLLGQLHGLAEEKQAGLENTGRNIKFSKALYIQ